MKVTKKLMDKIIKMADTAYDNASWPRGDIIQRVMPQAIGVDWPQNWDLGGHDRKIAVYFVASVWHPADRPGGSADILLVERDCG